MSKIYTVDDVKSHNSTSDCWVIFKGKVYDITNFLEDHPGGQEIILEHAGADCTVAFDDVGHSESAYDMLKDFCIGEIGVRNAGSCCSSKQECHAEASDSKSPKSKPKGCQSSSNNLPIISAVVIIGAAIVYNSFFKK